MRRHLSVLSLWWALSWKPLLSVVVALLLGEGAAFAWNWYRLAGMEEFSLDRLLPISGFYIFFPVLAAMLTVAGSEVRGSHIHYTLERLRVRPVVIVLWHWACIALCLLVLWAVQVGALLVLSGVYCRLADPAYVSGQTVFLAAYRINLFHQLLPLEAWSTWVRNAVLFLGLSLACACLASRMRQGRGSGAQVVVALLELLFLIAFSSVMPTAYGDVLVICGVLAVMAIWRLYLAMDWKEGGGEDEVETP